MSNKRHYAWRELVAKKRRGEHGIELPAYQDFDDSNDNDSEQGSIDDTDMADDDSDGKTITTNAANTQTDLDASFNEVTPPLTYLVSTGGLPTFSSIRDGDDIVRIVGSGHAALLPLIPDKLACVLRSKAQMHYVSTVFPGNAALAQHLERLDSWAGFCIERYFGSKNLNGYNTLRNFVRLSMIFREVPPAVVSGLATLLSAKKNSQREAAMLLKWIPPYAWLGHSMRIFNFVVPMILGPPENAFYGMYAAECAIRKLTATCTADADAATSAFFGPLPARCSTEDRKRLVAELCKYSLNTGRKRIEMQKTQHHLTVLEALLSLLEAVAGAAETLPDIKITCSLPRTLVETLFVVPSAMFVSRTLAALAALGRNAHMASENKGFVTTVGKVRRALADPEGEFSLVAHPGLRHLAKSFAEKARVQAAKSGSGMVDTSLGNIMKKHKASLVKFYANHSVDGIKKFVDMWPFDSN